MLKKSALHCWTDFLTHRSSHATAKRSNQRLLPFPTAGEVLESRLMLTAIVMTPQEQLLLELINRARADPAAEAAMYNIDLNQGLNPGTISTTAKQPLAPHQSLIIAAGLHSEDMLAKDYFEHDNKEGLTPSDRAKNAGYPVGVGENISWGGSTGQINQDDHVYQRHESLFRSPGHRVNIMNNTYRELGNGVRYGRFTDDGTTYNASMVTENFGNRGGNVFITGVAYADTVVADDFFTIGEEAGDLTITAVSAGGQTFTTTTGPSGGYALQVPNGQYTVTASGDDLNGSIVIGGVNVVSQNAKVDFDTTTAVPAAELVVEIDTSSIREDAGSAATTATVSRTGDTSAAVTVTLMSNDVTEATVPVSVTLGIGQPSMAFSINAVDDAILDGSISVTISAMADGYVTGANTLLVDDYELPVMTAPAASTTDDTPTFDWDDVGGTSRYDLWVDNRTTGETEIIRETNIAPSNFTPVTPLPAGNYRAWVRAINSAGVASEWSSQRNFTIESDTPAAPEWIGPAGTTDDTTPTFTWNAVDNADHYDLWVNNLTTGQEEVIREQNIASTGFTPTVDLTAGNYRAWVRAISGNGMVGDWSERLHFTVATSAPGVPAWIGPAASTSDATPEFSWTAATNADHYDLWVNNLTTKQEEILHETDIDGTSFSPDEALTVGNYRAWVRAINAEGTAGDWSSRLHFSITLAKPSLTGPASTTDDSTPTITWNAVDGAVRYDVWVDNRSTGTAQVIRDQDVAGTSLTPTSALADGNYRAWVRAFDANDNASSWSSQRDFTVDTAALSTPVLTAPTGSVSDTTPEFAWSAVTGATHYDLWVRNLTTGVDQVIREMNVTATSFTPTTALSAASYRVWVRALGDDGAESNWSSQLDFTIANNLIDAAFADPSAMFV